MPNHVKNRIELLGAKADVQALIDAYLTHVAEQPAMTWGRDSEHICEGPSGEFVGWYNATTDTFTKAGPDRAKIQGLPEGVRKGVKAAFDLFPDFEKVIPPPSDPAYSAECTGAMMDNPRNWYRWNVAHWGTKWNSYSHERPAHNVFVFETAWTMPDPVLRAMAAAHPQVGFRFCWADEDFGANCGVLSVPLAGEMPDTCGEVARWGDRIVSFVAPEYRSEGDNVLGYYIAAKVRPGYCEDIRYYVLDRDVSSLDDDESEELPEGAVLLRDYVADPNAPEREALPQWFADLGES